MHYYIPTQPYPVRQQPSRKAVSEETMNTLKRSHSLLLSVMYGVKGMYLSKRRPSASDSSAIGTVMLVEKRPTSLAIRLAVILLCVE